MNNARFIRQGLCLFETDYGGEPENFIWTISDGRELALFFSPQAFVYFMNEEHPSGEVTEPEFMVIFWTSFVPGNDLNPRPDILFPVLEYLQFLQEVFINGPVNATYLMLFTCAYSKNVPTTTQVVIRSRQDYPNPNQ